MQECWYALTLALLSVNYNTPEMAFRNLGNGAISKYNNTLTDADFEDMLILKNELKYQDLSDIYGIELTCLFKRIKAYEKQKTGSETT